MTPVRPGAPPLRLRLLLLAFPRRFRRLHGDDLLELYRDFATHRRSIGRWGVAVDALRNGLAARLDDRRAPEGPRTPSPPRNPRAPMDSIRQDLVFGARMLRKSPVFTAVAVLSLAIGIAANTAVFGFIDASLLRSLPVEDPDELVVLGWRTRAGTEMPDVSTWGWFLRDEETGDGLSSSYSLRAYRAMREGNRVLAATFAFADASPIVITVEAGAERATGQYVTGNYYAALGIRPALGRLIVENDDLATAPPVAVLSHGYWSRRFGRDEGVLGETILVNGAPFEVVGVAPAGFRGTLQVGDHPDVTLPVAQQPQVSSSSRDMSEPRFWWLHVMGRLRDGVDREAAEADLDGLFQRSVEADLFPEGVPERFTLPEVDLRPGHQGMTEQRGRMLTALMTVAGVTLLVLVIACVNVANLLLARSATRRREIAVRLSIGASRWRLVRQLVAESVVLSALAGLVGVLLAVGARDALLALMISNDLHIDGLGTDVRVIGFGVLVSLLTGVAFGLVPAIRASRPDLTPALKQGGASGAHGGGLWGLRSLLVVQVALSMVLLVAAGLFVRTLGNLQQEATGFVADDVAILSLDLGLNGYDGAAQWAFYDDAMARMRALPGVVAATVTNHTPLSYRISFTTLKIAGYEPGEDERMRAFYNLAGPQFFDTFRIPLSRGRGIDADDREGRPMVAVVNQTFVDTYFPDESPLGRRIGLGEAGDPGEYEIVGVAADVKYQQLRDEMYPVAHIAAAQHPGALRAITLAVRTDGDTGEALAAARRVVREADPEVPVFDVRTLAQQQARTLESEILLARLSAALGILALALASMGLYGILSYSVDRRTREIGVRMALGARAEQVVAMVMHEIRTVLFGLAVGIGAALAVTRYLESQLYGLSTRDPLTMLVASVVLVAVAAAAAYLPARRASSVDPIIALRSE